MARALADRYRVIELDSPGEALSHLSDDVVLIVIELESSKSEGFELLRHWQGAQADAPVLAITNDGDVTCAVEAMKLGAADCVVKPIDAAELREAVAALVDQSKDDSRPKARQSADRGGRANIDIPPGTSLEDLERVAVVQALAEHHGNRTHAAKTLGISVRTLQRKLKAWGIPLLSLQASSEPNGYLFASHGANTAYTAHAH